MTRGPIVVTEGETRAALASVRSLGAAGHPVHVVAATPRPLAGASRHAAASHRLVDPAAEPDRFARDLVELADRIGAEHVLPIGEASLGAVYESGRLEPPRLLAAPQEAYARAVDKHGLLERARVLGLDVPRSRLIECPASLETLPGDFAYPVVLKARRSRFRRAGGWQAGGVHVLSGPDDLAAVRDDPGLAGGALLQEYIEGHGEAVFLLSAGERVHAVFAHRRLREKPPAGGVSVLRESIEPDPELLDGSRRLLASLDWQGVAMVEFRRGTDGRAALMEINPRLWGSLQLAGDAGLDFPVLWLRQHRQEPLERLSARIGVRSRWLLGDLDHLLICLRRPAARAATGRRAGRVVLDFLASFVDGSRTEVFRWDDPRPFFRELAQWPRG